MSSRPQTARASLALLAIAFAAACADAPLGILPTPGRGDSSHVDTTRVDTSVVTVVARVELDADALTIDEGATRRLAATTKDALGRTLDGRTVTWTSSDAQVAAVSPDGVITALRGGSATITASAEGKSAQVIVTVAAPTHAYDLLFAAFVGLPEQGIYRVGLGASEDAPSRLPYGPGAKAVVSPDGRRVAITAPDGGQTRIFVVDRDGSHGVAITPEGVNDDQPVWSPDGTRIAFHRWNYVGTPHDVWVANADGSNAVNITADLPGEQRAPTWSPRQPDGRYRIAFAHVTRGAQYLRAQIYSARDDGSDGRALTPLDDTHLDDEPAWSPDGRTVLFKRIGGDAVGDLWLVDADGGAARQLLKDGPRSEMRSPAWSPDGRLVAFTSAHEIIGPRAGDWQVYTVRADGTGLVRRTSTPGDKANVTWAAR